MLRVAFVVEKFPNISETFILDEIVGVIERGVEVDVYALRRGGAADIHPAYRAHSLDKRTFYCVPAVQGRIARILAAIPATGLMLLLNAGAFFRCALTRKRGIQSRTIVSLARAFVNSGNTYDVVHAHFGPNGIRAEALRRSGAMSAPLVTTFHGYDATSFVRENGAAVYADLASGGQRFIAVSQSIADRLSEIGIPASKTDVMPLGIDCARFAELPRPSAEAVVRVVSVGRFVEKKGFEFGIRAVVAARKRYPALLYDIIGDGPLRPTLESLVAELDAAKYVTFHGFKDQAAVGMFLGQADIMLVPSVTAADGDTEGLPIVVKEAMARGLPIVGSLHAGIPEIVIQAVTGFLANERDHASLAEYLCELASDVDKRRAFGAAARTLAERDLNNTYLIDQLVLLYRRVAAGDGSSIGEIS